MNKSERRAALLKGKGIAGARKIFGNSAAEALADIWSELDPQVGQAMCDHAYGTMYSREVLTQRERELCAVMTLTALDKQGALGFHVKAALQCGATREEVEEAIVQAHLYAGYPCVMSSLATMKRVFSEVDGEKE